MLLTVHPDSIRQADGFVLPEHRVGIDAVVVTLIHARKEQTRSVERDIETTKLWYESYAVLIDTRYAVINLSRLFPG